MSICCSLKFKIAETIILYKNAELIRKGGQPKAIEVEERKTTL